MSTPELVPRHRLRGVIAVWVAALVSSVAVAVFAPEPQVMLWMILGMGGCFILAFAIQLSDGHAEGFIERVAASVVGALLLLGVVSLVVGLVSLARVSAG